MEPIEGNLREQVQPDYFGQLKGKIAIDMWLLIVAKNKSYYHNVNDWSKS